MEKLFERQSLFSFISLIFLFFAKFTVYYKSNETFTDFIVLILSR